MSYSIWTAAQEAKRTRFTTLPPELRGGEFCDHCAVEVVTICADCERPVCRQCGPAHQPHCDN